MNRSRFFSGDSPIARSNAEHVPHVERPSAIEDHDIGPDQDYPMDAFDQQLLMGCDSGNFELFKQGPERISFPSRAANVSARVHIQNSLRDDLLDVRQLPTSSSSPASLISSPTVSALRNRSQASQRSHQVVHGSSQTFAQQLRKRNSQIQVQSPANNGPVARTYDLPHAPPVIQGIPLVSTDRLPDHLRSVFKFDLFNAVQSRCFPAAFETDDNIVLSAPTGSGKTVVMELAICRLLITNKTRDFKIVYQAPTKSLCSERYRDWAARFSTLGLQCAELTGDVEYGHLKSVQSAHIIVTTPEKWDSVTRKWRDNAKLMQMIKIFLVDEVHILNESRGAALEAIVSRMKSAGSGVRFVALSATVPNSEDIATWLGKCPTAQHLPAHREVFDEKFRPTTLEKHVVGFNCRPNSFALDSMLTKEIPSLIARHANRKPVMIFCVTKNSAAKTAHALADLWFSTTEHLRLWSGPKRQGRIMNQDLQKLISAGVAFHHSGLDPADRHAVEQGFLQGDINIICSTSTLAVGVNLPCYLVMLKGTSCWSDKGLQEYSSLEVMQMLGRAGRPQFETSACAVILTHREKVRQYEEMVSGQETLESFLHENLIEHLNAEIGIGTIHDMDSAKRWLASSFLSVRLRRNPGHYRLVGRAHNDSADHLLEQICERDLDLLESAELIEQRHGFRCTEYGDAMARYYIRYDTMTTFLKMPPKPRISEILNVLAKAQEFNDVKVRSGEKSLYKQINQENDIRFPIKVDIALPIHKTSLLIQAHLGGVVVDKSNAKHAAQLKQDTLMVINHCNRLIRCIIDVEIHRQDAVGVRNALELCRSIAAGVWDNTPMQLKQIETIGDVTARRLASAGINSVETLLTTEPHRIEVVLGKIQPFGSTLLQKAAKFPNLYVCVKEVSSKRKAPTGGADIRLKCEIGHLNESLPAFFNRKGVYICFLCETSCGKLIDFRRFGAKKLQSGDVILLTVSLDRQCIFIRCHVMCEEIAGTNRFAELKLNLPDAWFPTSKVSAETAVPQAASLLTESTNFDTFDDSDLIDEDFLAAESDVGRVEEVYEDIDEYLASAKQNTVVGNHLKRKASAVTATSQRDTDTITRSKPYREPTRLANGNWTCQHACNEEGKECKHACCKEGVKKPKKRVNSSATITKKDSNIKNAFARPYDNARKSHDKIYDIDEILQDSAKFRNLAHLNGTSSMNISSGIQTKESRMEKDREAITAQSIYTNDIGSDDWPSASKIISQRPQGETDINKNQCDTNLSDGQQVVYNIESFDFNVDDCDWTINNDISMSPQAHVASQGAVNHDSSEQEQTQPNLLKSTMTSSADVRNILSPNTKRLTPINQAPCSGTHDNELEGDLRSFDVDENELVGLDVAFSSTLEPTPGRIESLESLDTRQTPDNQLTAIPDGHCKADDSTGTQETEGERKKRLHEEDQKRRWAKFPAWMYEVYGAYVDIVDE